MQDPFSPMAHGSAAKFYRRVDAAAYVQTTYGFPCSVRWLAKLAVVGGGPRFYKAGRTPLYAPADLDAWARARIGSPREDKPALQSTSSGAEVNEVGGER